jgi:hypothetical protein
MLQSVIRRLCARRDRERVEIAAAAQAAVDRFDGDLGRARLWAIDEAIRWDRAGDRRRNMAAVRIAREIKTMTGRRSAPGRERR